ncbi:MAG TPA: hypothetical protein VMT30_03235 [Candidatus Saccharimonadia bacterium]|nr:hypothetical protein [Candidatus Saccharimonadia bacterium]
MSKRVLFGLAALALAAASIYFRAGNTRTARLHADQIVAADTVAADTTTQLAALKTFVADHMGASVTFTLQGSYDRAVAAATAAAAVPDPNAQVYAAAQKACSGKSDSLTLARCNQAYLAQHLSTAPTPAPVPAPRAADYRRTFTAPLWTPDLAGALLAGAVAALILGNKRRKRSWLPKSH